LIEFRPDVQLVDREPGNALAESAVLTEKPRSSAVIVGALCAAAYLVLFTLVLAVSLMRNEAGYQVVVAVFTYPASWVAFAVGDPLLDWSGPFGTPARRAVEWALLGFAGALQYFLVGAVASFLLRRGRDELPE
jgi:hypothetical protein